MDITTMSFMSLIFSYLSSLLLSFVLLYMYKSSRLKYFCKFTIGCFVFSNIYLVQIINKSITEIPFLKLIVRIMNKSLLEILFSDLTISIIQFSGILFIILGLYNYFKNEVPKRHLYIAGIGALVIIIASLKILTIIEKDYLVYYLFGISMILGFMFCFYYFKNSHVGKHVSGVPMLILGVIYIRYSFNGAYGTNDYLSYFIEPLIFLLVSIGFLISYYEITKKELEISEKRYRLAMEGSNDGLWEYDIYNNTTLLSPKTLNLIGLSTDNTTIDLDIWKSFIHKEDLDNFNNNLQVHILGMTDHYRSEYRVKIKNGEYKWILAKGKVMLNEKGVPVKIIGSHTDTTDRKKSELKMFNLAYYDNITNLPNRIYFEEKLKEVSNNSPKFAVLAIGLNGFKNVNDSLGHDSGDEFLRIIGERMKNTLHYDNVLARFGGDQFVLLINNYKNIDELRSISKDILNEISIPILIKNCEFYLSGSIGISMYPKDSVEYKEILRNADLAMYKAKENGNNNFEFFDDFMSGEIHKRLYLEKSLHDAVNNNEFVVYYQLQKDIYNNRFTGAEALVRWINPDKGFVSPAEFIPLAEETGLIMQIGEFVLRESCKKAKELQDKGYNDFTISVNVSSIQLQSSGFVELVENVLNETKLEPKYLTLEITESIVMKSLDSNIIILEKLRKIGVIIALDDFGTGYSSFNYLLKLPIDILKIDKSFVDGIAESSKQESICGSIVYIAKKIKLNVVAEGVETNEQLDILRHQKCDKIQGYLFSKPIPENEIEKNIA